MTQATSTIEKYKYYLEKYKDVDMNDPEEAVETLKQRDLSLSYIKCILSAFIWKIRQEDPKNPILKQYRYIISSLRGQLERKERDPTDVHGIIPKWESIIKKRQSEWKEGHYKNHLILSLYTYIPPRRLKDYVLLKVVNTPKEASDKEFNYYITTQKSLVFNNYKTARTYNQQVEEVPDVLHEIIMAYCKDNDIESGDLLLGFHDILQMNYILKTLIGCSVDNIRHSYVNNQYEQYNMPSSEFIEKMASKMGHGVATNMRYRKYC